MFFFIILSLAISYWVHNEHEWLILLRSPLTLYIGIAVSILAIVSALTKKFVSQQWYDLFATGSLLIWYNYWSPYLREGSPVFYFFPLYFALVAAVFYMAFNRQHENLDQETIEFLHWLSDSGRFSPVFIVFLVVFGLLLRQHFLLYPAAITLLIMRHALAVSLEQ